MVGAVQRALQAVEARQRHAGGLPQHLGEKGGRTARHHRDQREGAGELGQQGRHTGERSGSRRVLDDGGQGPVEIEEEGTVRRVGGHAPERRGQLRPGPRPPPAGATRIARGGQRQVVVVVVEARSDPMTTTTSTPVTPVTGVAVVSGSTCVGFTPMAVAMAAAGSWKPAA